MVFIKQEKSLRRFKKFSLDDKHIIEWITSFEEKIKSLIYEKDLWFHDEPSEDEIDYLQVLP